MQRTPRSRLGSIPGVIGAGSLIRDVDMAFNVSSGRGPCVADFLMLSGSELSLRFHSCSGGIGLRRSATRAPVHPRIAGLHPIPAGSDQPGCFPQASVQSDKLISHSGRRPLFLKSCRRMSWVVCRRRASLTTVDPADMRALGSTRPGFVAALSQSRRVSSSPRGD